MAKVTSLSENGAGLGIEQKLWAAADKMRGSIDASEYKHVALGLLFLKYISDRFERKYESLETDEEREDRDEYIADGIFWVPSIARWKYLKENANSPQIGKMIDEAMFAIEHENKRLKGVLPKDYARPALDKTVLSGLINLFSDLDLYHNNEQDVLGRVYEYFLQMFASAEGKLGGEFYTPRSIVKLLVEMIEPFNGRVYDPACGSGGMFVQATKFISEHSGRVDNISIYGQEKNYTTWRLCNMNLAIRGISANLGGTHADTFHNDLHPDLKADYILANPPFNISDWGVERLQDDVRWKYGVPPSGNANYGWIQHMIHHLSPRGVIGLVLANGSMSSTSGGEGEIRKKLIEDDMIDCMVALPPQLFYSVSIPVCLWFIRRGKEKRRGETLFIDARKMGYMATRTNRDFTDGDIARIANTYHNWRTGDNKYEDIAGFCKSATIADMADQGFVLTPGRYVGTEHTTDDETFNNKMSRLTAMLSGQMVKADELDANIREQLAKIVPDIAQTNIYNFKDALYLFAETLFKSWFVNYDPFGGSVPADWGVRPISDLVDILSGYGFKSDTFLEAETGKYKLVTIKNVQDGRFDSVTKDSLNDLPDNLPDYCHLSSGDILLSLTGNVGRVCFVSGDNYLLNQRVAKLSPKNANDAFFTYLLFRSQSFFYEMQNLAVGSAQQNLSPVLTSKIEIPIPPRKVLDDFYGIVGDMWKKIILEADLGLCLSSFNKQD